MGDRFDRSRCSFPVPEFATAQDEDDWVQSLTPAQRLELLHLVRIARWGDDAANAPLDRSVMETMTMAEFSRRKMKQDADEESWRRAHGWPPRFGVPIDESRR